MSLCRFGAVSLSEKMAWTPDTFLWFFFAIILFGIWLFLWKRANHIVLFCVMLILGILGGMYHPVATRFTMWLFILAAVLGVGSAALKICHLNMRIPLGFCAFFFGLANASNRMDPSSPSHLSNFADDGRWGRTIVVGDVSMEPNIKATRTELTLSPITVIPHVKRAIVEGVAMESEDFTKPIGQTSFKDTLYPTEGKFSLNGRTFTYDAEGESIAEVLVKVRRSDLGIDFGRNATTGKIVLNYEKAKDKLLSAEDVEGNFLETLGIIHPVRGGKILVRVYRKALDELPPFDYGQRIRVTAALQPLEPSPNFAVKDFKEFYQHSNIWGDMRIFSLGRGIDLEILGEGGNWFVRWCLNLKKKLLFVTKRTVPGEGLYPGRGPSAFLGGVMLGLREGLSREVKDEFRASGVAHVLAVSGLHVTIIAGLCVVLFSMTKLPKTVWAPMAVFCLIVFTVITGGRPSTMRAMLMNSFALMFYTYFGKDVAKSVLMGMAFSAIVILTLNPLIVVEAAFTFSYLCVLSLVLLSRPLDEYFRRRLTTLFRILLSIWLFFTVVILLCNLARPLQGFLPPHWTYIVLTVALPVVFFTQGFFPQVRFARLKPRYVTQFASAQIGIFFGAVLPMGVAVFSRFAPSSVLANWLAIPLIGIIVPLGLIAGLIGLLPGFGIYLALLINAANFLGIQLFLKSTHFFATNFPYPSVPQPSMWTLAFYFGLIWLFILREPISRLWRGFFYRIRHTFSDTGVRVETGLAALVSVVVLVMVLNGFVFKDADDLKVTFLNTSSFGKGGGNCVFIETPRGKIPFWSRSRKILVDGGLRTFEGGVSSELLTMIGEEAPEKKKEEGKKIWDTDIGEGVVFKYLLANNVLILDKVVLTNPMVKNAGGLIHILNARSIRVRELVVPLDPKKVGPDASLEDFVEALGDSRLKKGSAETQEMYTVYRIILAAAKEGGTKITYGHRDVNLFDTKFGGKKLSAAILNPAPGREATENGLHAHSMAIQLRFGEVSMLLTGDIDAETEKTLVAKYGELLPSQILQVPDNGGASGIKSSSYDFIKAVSPEVAVIQNVYDRKTKDNVKKVSRRYRYEGETLTGREVETLDTDAKRYGAVEIKTNGKTYDVLTRLKPEWEKKS